MTNGPVKVRRPRAIVFDILGTASKSGFLERVLFPFLKQNLENYINSHWNNKDFIRTYRQIQEQSLEHNRQDPNAPLVADHETSQGRASLMSFINFVTDNGINSPTVTKLRFKVWFEGYQQSKLETPIYRDVAERYSSWFAEGVKFYVYSNSWVEAQKAMLKSTNHGDLTTLISGHYDSDFGPLTESDTWRRFCSAIHEAPENVLFLTKAVAEARAASDAGLPVVMVLTHRHNVKGVPAEDRQRFPYVRTLRDLSWLEGAMMPTGSSRQELSGGGRSRSHSGPQAGAGSPPGQPDTGMSGGSSAPSQVASGARSSTRTQTGQSTRPTARGAH